MQCGVIMKKFLALMLACFFALAGFAQKEYEVLSSTELEEDSTVAKVSGVYTLGDSIVVLEGFIRPANDEERLIPPIMMHLYSYCSFSRSGRLSQPILRDSCSLRAIMAIDPVTGKRTEDDLFGIGYWKNVKAGQGYHFLAAFNGRIPVGCETLRWNYGLEHGGGVSVKIDNSLEDAMKVRRVAHPTTTVNVRQSASASSPIVAKADKNQMLVAEYQLGDQSAYCEVVVLSNGKRGYVNRRYLSMGQTLPKVSHGALTRISRGGGVDVKPTIEIDNQTGVAINVSLSGKSYKFRPNEKRTITVNAGPCYQIVTGAGHNPYYGMDELQEGSSYSWTFVTKSHKR